MKIKYPSNILTVIIRDDAPLIHCQGSSSYRSVSIELTKEQVEQLQLMATSSSGTTDFYEEIDRCFIEPPKYRICIKEAAE